MAAYFGIYKGRGTYPWFGGQLQHNGEPASYGPGVWAGSWFKTKREAREYAALAKNEMAEFSKSFLDLA